MRGDSSVVYIVRVPLADKCKIGRTQNLPQRLAALRRQSGEDLQVVRFTPGSERVEAWFHATFSDHRISGEWFRFVEEMLTIEAPAEIVALDDGGDAPIDRSFLDPLVRAIAGAGTAKEIAEACDCSEATAARYKRGDTYPDPLRLAALMGRYAPVATAVLEMAGFGEIAIILEENRIYRRLEEIQNSRIAAQYKKIVGGSGNA